MFTSNAQWLHLCLVLRMMPTQSRRKPSQSTSSILYPQIISSKESTRLGCSMFCFFVFFFQYLQGNDTGKVPKNMPPLASAPFHPHEDTARPWSPEHALQEGWSNSNPLAVWSGQGNETSSDCLPVPAPGSPGAGEQGDTFPCTSPSSVPRKARPLRVHPSKPTSEEPTSLLGDKLRGPGKVSSTPFLKEPYCFN